MYADPRWEHEMGTLYVFYWQDGLVYLIKEISGVQSANHTDWIHVDVTVTALTSQSPIYVSVKYGKIRKWCEIKKGNASKMYYSIALNLHQNSKMPL